MQDILHSQRRDACMHSWSVSLRMTFSSSNGTRKFHWTSTPLYTHPHQILTPSIASPSPFNPPASPLLRSSSKTPALAATKPKYGLLGASTRLRYSGWNYIMPSVSVIMCGMGLQRSSGKSVPALQRTTDAPLIPRFPSAARSRLSLRNVIRRL